MIAKPYFFKDASVANYWGDPAPPPHFYYWGARDPHPQLKGWRLSDSNNHVVIKSFSGATLTDMEDYLGT